MTIPFGTTPNAIRLDSLLCSPTALYSLGRGQLFLPVEAYTAYFAYLLLIHIELGFGVTSDHMDCIPFGGN